MKKRVVCLLLLVLLLAAVFPGRVGMASEQRLSQDITNVEKEAEQPFSNLNGITGRYSSLSQLEHLRIGIPSGTNFDLMMHERFPEADFFYYNSQADLLAALDSGKIDAFPSDEPVIRYIMGQRSDITYIPEYVDHYEAAYCFPKTSEGKALCDQFSAFIRSLKASGQLSDIEEKWFQHDESIKPILDYGALPAVNGTLTLATDGDYVPFEYVRDGVVVGYDIEIAALFCEANGYALRVEIMNMDAIVPSVKTGKCDVGGSALSITPERAESVLFSEPNYAGGTVMVVQSIGTQATRSVSWRDYDGKRIGVLVGPLMEDVANECFPNSEHLLFNTYPDCITALLAGRIDAYLGDELGVKTVHAEQPQVDYIHERITENNYSFAFRKNDPESAKLCAELNAFLARSWTDGTMQELEDIWLGVDEARKVVDMSDLTGENGTIKVVTTSTDAPFSYIKDGKNVGYDIDLVVRFCRDRGYALELGDVDFAGRIPAIESGKYDFTTDMNVTPEREEQVLFSDPVCKGGIVLAVLAKDLDTAAADGVADIMDMAGKRIAVQTGTISGEVTQSVIPDVKLEYFNSQTDCLAALRARKVDAWASDEPGIRFLMIDNEDLQLLGTLDASELAAVFAKTEAGQALCAQYSAFVDSLWANGTMDEIKEVWFGADEQKRTVLDYEALPDTNGTLRMAVDTSVMPFALVKDNRVMGYDVDIAARFCQANGYRLEVIPMDFAGVLPSVQSGKVDFASTGITVTEERAESVLFSSPNYHSGTALAVLKDEAAPAAGTSTVYTSLDDLNGKRIGVQTGTICGALVESRLPDAEVLYFNSQTDALTALKAGKADAWVTDEPIIRFMKIDNPGLVILEGFLSESNLAAVFPKTEAGQALCSQYTAFLEKLWADGTMEQIDAVWFGADGSKRTAIDYEGLPAVNGTLRMAADLSQPPFTYMEDNHIVGYDVDVAARFCQEYGYGLEIVPMSFDAMLASVQSGKCEFADSCITITEERAESMLFSMPNYYGGIAVALWGANASGQTVSDTGAFTSVSQLNGKRMGISKHLRWNTSPTANICITTATRTWPRPWLTTRSTASWATSPRCASWSRR